MSESHINPTEIHITWHHYISRRSSSFRTFIITSRVCLYYILFFSRCNPVIFTESNFRRSALNKNVIALVEHALYSSVRGSLRKWKKKEETRKKKLSFYEWVMGLLYVYNAII